MIGRIWIAISLLALGAWLLWQAYRGDQREKNEEDNERKEKQ